MHRMHDFTHGNGRQRTGHREGLVSEGGRWSTAPPHSPHPRTPQPDPTGIPIGPLVTERPLFSRLVSLLELVARVAMVAARAWIATGIRCCSRAMYLSLAIDTFASEERLDISCLFPERRCPAIDTSVSKFRGGRVDGLEVDTSCNDRAASTGENVTGNCFAGEISRNTLISTSHGSDSYWCHRSGRAPSGIGRSGGRSPPARTPQLCVLAWSAGTGP